MSETSRGEPFDVGDRVRIDIPDETHPDYKHHGKNGEVISVIPSPARSRPAGGQDDGLYRVALDIGGTVDVRARDLRPPI